MLGLSNGEIGLLVFLGIVAFGNPFRHFSVLRPFSMLLPFLFLPRIFLHSPPIPRCYRGPVLRGSIPHSSPAGCPKDIPVIARAAGRLTGRAMGFVHAARTKFSSFADQSQLSELQQEVQQAMAQLQTIRHQLNSGMPPTLHHMHP
ncbi:unnamed protein product [Closterium sp. NIES-65]|nr:unnamed protein product [Closterium sp. NIES-65]